VDGFWSTFRLHLQNIQANTYVALSDLESPMRLLHLFDGIQGSMEVASSTPMDIG